MVLSDFLPSSITNYLPQTLQQDISTILGKSLALVGTYVRDLDCRLTCVHYLLFPQVFTEIVLCALGLKMRDTVLTIRNLTVQCGTNHKQIDSSKAGLCWSQRDCEQRRWDPDERPGEAMEVILACKPCCSIPPNTH